MLLCRSYLVLCAASALCVWIPWIDAVDRGNFKTCTESAFCRLHRNLRSSESVYTVVASSVAVTQTSLCMYVKSYRGCDLLKIELFVLKDNTLRFRVSELRPAKQRYEIPVGDVLITEPEQIWLEVLHRDEQRIVATFGEDNVVVVHLAPFTLDIIKSKQLVMSINSLGLMKFQQTRAQNQGIFNSFFWWLSSPFREKVQDDETTQAAVDPEENSPIEEDYKPGEESFKSFKDTKPNGPSSVGVDITFPHFQYLYGIPEHADNLVLKSTKSDNSDPYRLYNLDVFEYELHNPMALYGSVPLVIAHNLEMTLGMLWLNAAETWIDIERTTVDQSAASRVGEFASTDIYAPQTNTHWFSESGNIDLFIMLGTRPADVFRQYARLTGTTPLPPLFALAYHQSRWNYNDEQDVRNVDAGFDEHGIPMDVIWLDIEHTDGKRYFTWDKYKFRHPEEMIRNISAKGRRMVTIIDPHIKRDSDYYIYKEARSSGYLVQNKDGSEYEGWCWPGSSSWLDFTSADVRKFWASKFALSQYKGSTLDLFTWNDMNEPSVFNGPEITMHKDALHIDGWEHRDVHNLYGLYVHRASIEGQIERSSNQSRPFVLSRAFFAGSQRYGAVWTGDNTADWGHLKISIPMLLTLNLVGLTLSGADVGGFFRNPDAELLTRWYQAAAYQPFFRAHAHLDTRRREPWLLNGEQYLKAIRQAVRQRYRLLPYWYTLFYEAELNGGPVMRPLWVEFPSEKETFGIDDEHMVGSAILVHPVTERGATSAIVYLPGRDEVWYEFDTHSIVTGGVKVNVAVDIYKTSQHSTRAFLKTCLNTCPKDMPECRSYGNPHIYSMPVFLRGGFIIPIRDRVRRSSSLVPDDPYSLLVTLDNTGNSQGRLYHDDFTSFRYKNEEFVYQEFIFTANNRTLSSRNLQSEHSFRTNSWLERITVIGLNKSPTSIKLITAGKDPGAAQLAFIYNSKTQTLVIRKPGVNISTDFLIVFS